MISTIPTDRIYFFDEAGFTGADSIRNSGWGQSRRIFLSTPYFSRSSLYTLLCIVGVNGILASYIHTGSTRGVNVRSFFADYVIASIPDYSLIVMDNHPMHHGIAGNTLSQILDLKNCCLGYLPPYSPDLNPIENVFGTIKYHLKNHPNWFMMDPTGAILKACQEISPDQINSRYNICGILNR